MKSFIKGLSLAALFTLAAISGAANAQQKLAVVDVQDVLLALPQVEIIEGAIEAEFTEQMKEVKRLNSDGKFLLEKLQREKATMSAQQILDLEGQINTVGQQLREKGKPLQENMKRRTEEERNKLFGLIQQAIDDIAKEDDYDMVLNSNAVPFSKSSFNITQQVLEQVSKAK
ncbi:MAG: outer membrane protein [Alphaproteobacteria bacterium]